MANGNPPRQPGNNPSQAGQGEPRTERGLKSLRDVDVDSLAAEAHLEYPTARAILEYVKANPTAEGLDSLIAGLGVTDEVRDRLIGKYRLAADPRVPATVGMPIRPGAVEAARATEAQKKGWFQGIKRTLGAVIEPINPSDKGKRGYAVGMILGLATYAGTFTHPFGMPVKIGLDASMYLTSATIDTYYKNRIKNAKSERAKIEYETKRRLGTFPFIRDFAAGWAAGSLLRALPAVAAHGLSAVGESFQKMPVEGAEALKNAGTWLQNSPLVRDGGNAVVTNVPAGVEHNLQAAWGNFHGASGAAMGPELMQAAPYQNLDAFLADAQRITVEMQGMSPTEIANRTIEVFGANLDYLRQLGDPSINKEIDEFVHLTGAGTDMRLLVKPDIVMKESQDILTALGEYQRAHGIDVPLFDLTPGS